MGVIAVVLVLFGAVGATAAGVKETPRYARWYRRWARSPAVPPPSNEEGRHGNRD